MSDSRPWGGMGRGPLGRFQRGGYKLRGVAICDRARVGSEGAGPEVVSPRKPPGCILGEGFRCKRTGAWAVCGGRGGRSELGKSKATFLPVNFLGPRLLQKAQQLLPIRGLGRRL